MVQKYDTTIEDIGKRRMDKRVKHKIHYLRDEMFSHNLLQCIDQVNNVVS